MFGGSDRRRRQKRRGGDEKKIVPAAPTGAPALTVESCELVDVGGSQALLRVAGTWSSRALERVDLVCFGTGAIVRIEPLPPGPSIAADGLWHIAFCVAESATAAHMALMTASGVAVGLPAPERLHPAPDAPPPAAPTPASEQPGAEERLEQALADLADSRALVEQLRRRCRLSERALAEFRDKLVSAWGEAASLRELLDEREAELCETRQHAPADPSPAQATAAANEVPPAEEPPTPPASEPWSRVDEDLLDRLARAKSLAGQD